jgi:hypothetical protein
MNQPEIFDRDVREQDIKALQEWLRNAWRQLSNTSLTPFARRELRNQMKQCSADLKAHLVRLQAQQTPPRVRDFNRPTTRPEFRLLA